MKINLPNQITIGRLFVAIIFLVCLAQFSIRDDQPKMWLLDLCGALFVLAAVTDAVDGYLARKQGQVTSFGRILDPFVDKVLVCGAYIFLAGEAFVDATGHKVTSVALWMVVVIVGRELLVTGLRGFTEAQGKDFGANIYGKAKMVLQSVTVGWILFTLAHPDGILGLAFFQIGRPVMVWLTVIVTILSMITYLWSARSALLHTSVETK
ncbi:MAG: CDP-diacylglycerol--glycerol-3-phosphate 3-phosphatidyltransferase [Planctomycetota bacterium]|jgi:CDP-diacylglycerol--glycerol-3-phosphate 3-phosphatidyltransferase